MNNEIVEHNSSATSNSVTSSKSITYSAFWNWIWLAVSLLLSMGMWFSTLAVTPNLSQYTYGINTWMALAIQFGFVIGTIISAIYNAADRFSSRSLFIVSCLVAATLNIAMLGTETQAEYAILLRFLIGFCYAGIYPTGLKLAISWSIRNRGLGVGIMLGAITIGTASPHLIPNWSSWSHQSMSLNWDDSLIVSSIMAVLSACTILLLVREGPHLKDETPLNLRYILHLFRNKAVRLTNYGYFGHMWELYAMWVWMPAFLSTCYAKANWDQLWEHSMSFSIIAIGAIGCISAGFIADRLGRTYTTIGSLLLSGTCALSIGLLINYPVIVSIIALVWGATIVADSAQFSAAISELVDPRYVGTALTIQTGLGFLITLISIWLIPLLVDWIGWEYAFSILAIGPICGILSMKRLRGMDESLRMANGKR